MIRAAVIGGAGYIGGELLRILISHPHVQVAAVTSRSLRGRQVEGVHPNLRRRATQAFISEDELEIGRAHV